jgi:hypothetical protein
VKKQLSYRTKFHSIIAGAVVLIGLSIKFSISKTVHEFLLVNSIGHSKSITISPKTRLQHLQKQKEKLYALSFSSSMDSNTTHIQFDFISKCCDSTQTMISDYPEKFTQTSGKYFIETNVYRVQGGYCNLLRLIRLIEKSPKTGILASATFDFTSNSGYNSEKKLTASLILQKISALK